MATTLRVDMDSFTLRELEDLSDACGLDIVAMQAGAEFVPSVKMVRAFAWIIKRRADPGFTFEAAGNLTMADVTEITDAFRPNAGAAPAASANGSHPSPSSTAGARRKRSGV